MTKANIKRTDPWRQRLVELLEKLTDRDGTHATRIEGVELWRSSVSIPRHPVVYQPKIIVVGQGHKLGYLGDEIYHYDPYNYLVLPVPLPFECETQANTAEPLLAVTVAIDPAVLGELLLEMDEAAPKETVPRGIYSSPLRPQLSDAVIRLLECLRSPADAHCLGRQTVREIIYRVLQGPQGGVLHALASRNENFTRIARVLAYIHTDYAQPITSEDLARQAGMSTSVFHRNFKLVTATSPLQYVKQVRLHRARTLMAYDGHNASMAATAVGYESASQFGREFKRLFGAPPGREAANIRARLAAGGGSLESVRFEPA